MSAIDPRILYLGDNANAESSSMATDPDDNAQAGVDNQNEDTDEQQSRDRALADILANLDGDYRPMVPDELVDYYLQRAGFETEDVRLKRLLALTAQKFVSDIATDAFQYARTRTNSAPGTRGRPAGGDSQGRRDRNKTTLTMEDLSAALAEHGVNASRRPYYL